MDVLRNFLFALRGVLQRHFAIPGQRPAVLPRENGAQTEKYVRARRNQEKTMFAQILTVQPAFLNSGTRYCCLSDIVEGFY